MYSTAKFVFTAGMLILLGIAFWMKASDIDLHGSYVRGGRMHGNTLTPGAVFFFAMLFAAALIWLLIKEKKDRSNDKDRYGDYPKY